MTGRYTALLLSAVVAFSAAPSVSAQTIRGLVIEASTGRPIPLATVTLVFESGERLSTALTTDEGFFSLEGDREGTYLVRATALGYSPGRAGPVHLESGATQVLEVPLTIAPIGIEGVVVQGAAVGNYLTEKGFWDRYEEGRGQFLTPGEVLASDAMFTPHLLRGLKHVVPQFGAAPWSVWPILGVTERRGCKPRVFIDDVWLNRPGPQSLIPMGLGLDDVVPIERVQAIEVFYGPFQAPMKYQGTTRDNDCGVILIWTR